MRASMYVCMYVCCVLPLLYFSNLWSCRGAPCPVKSRSSRVRLAAKKKEGLRPLAILSRLIEA